MAQTGGEQRLAAVLDKYDNVMVENEQGEMVERLPVQRELTLEWFKLATGEEDFDVFSTINEDSVLVAGDPFQENLRRACRLFHRQSERTLDEVEQQIVEWEQENEDQLEG